MMARFVMVAAAMPCLALGACGGETTDGGPTRVDSGVPDDRPLDALTPSELQRVCDATLAVGLELVQDPAVVRGLCIAFVGAFSESREECETVAAQCVDNTDEALDMSLTADTSCNPEVFETCDGTVGELEACYAESAAWLWRLSRSDCSTTRDDLTVDADTLETCTSLESRCPSLFEGESVTVDFEDTTNR